MHGGDGDSGTNSSRGLRPRDTQVVSRISDDWTIPREASWERSELKTAGGLGGGGGVDAPQKIVVFVGS